MYVVTRYMTYRNGEDIFDTLKTPVDKLKALKVQMLSASIGVVIKDRTLKFISTESGNRHVFKSEYASALIEKLKNIVETDCLEIGILYSFQCQCPSICK